MSYLEALKRGISTNLISLSNVKVLGERTTRHSSSSRSISSRSESPCSVTKMMTKMSPDDYVISKSSKQRRESKYKGGKKCQRGGMRLETECFRVLPKPIQRKIEANVIVLAKTSQEFYNSDGSYSSEAFDSEDSSDDKTIQRNLAVEFDMIYTSIIDKKKICFEIKGVNNTILQDDERIDTFIRQGKRQQEYLKNNYKDYDITCVFCFITGKTINKCLNNALVSIFGKHGIIVIQDETPYKCMTKAVKELKLLK